MTRLLALLVLAVGVARLDTVEAYTFQDPALPLAVEQADAVPGAVLDLAEMLRWVTVEELPAAMQLVRQVEVKRAMSDPASELDAGAGGAASGDVLPQLVRATAMILASQLAAELLLTWLTPERDIMPAKLQKNKVRASICRLLRLLIVPRFGLEAGLPSEELAPELPSELPSELPCCRWPSRCCVGSRFTQAVWMWTRCCPCTPVQSTSSRKQMLQELLSTPPSCIARYSSESRP